jgi:hypothetical protein
MKKSVIVFLVLAFISSSFVPNTRSTGKSVMPEIPHEIFINGSSNDFESIFDNNFDIKDYVKELYQSDQIPHKSVLYYPSAPEFTAYWQNYSTFWRATKLQPNSNQIELIFNGKLLSDDNKETFELYSLNVDAMNPSKPIFQSEGVLLSYKISPNTGEIILYIHDYPCCFSAGHNIIQLRVIDGTCKSKKRFFIARDRDDITGPFFPSKVHFSPEIHQLNAPKELLWSPERINKNAFIGQSDKNFIAKFDAGAYYFVLAEWDKNWQFVLFLNGIMDEASAVVNPINFKNRPIFGFISKENDEF